MQEVALYSDALQQNFDLLIYIPANYSPLYEYNICIASDGRDYFQLGSIQRVADELIDSYDIENTIIVGVPYINAADRKRKYIPSGDQFEQYMHFLAHELLPYLQEHYAISNDVEKRTIIGDSMAGTAALMAAIHYPHLFGKVGMQSPYVDNLIMDKVRAFNVPNSFFVYHIIGLGEVEVLTTDKMIKDFLTPNRELHALIQEKNMSTFYEEFNGNHTWTYWKPDLKRMLSQILE